MSWWHNWHGLNWRGKWARVYSYFKVGNNLMQDVKNVIIIAAGAKILGLTVGLSFLLGGVLILVLPALGWGWMRSGLYRQEQEIPMIDGWNKPQNFDRNLIVAMAKRLGVPLHLVSADVLCPEIQAVLASRKETP